MFNFICNTTSEKKHKQKYCSSSLTSIPIMISCVHAYNRTHIPTLYLCLIYVVDSQNCQQFHIKIQCGSTGDNPPGASITIGQPTRQNNVPSFSHLHRTKCLVPSSNNLSSSNLELEWSSTITGTIKLFRRIEPIEPSGIMRLYGLSGRGNGTIAFFGDEVF